MCAEMVRLAIEEDQPLAVQQWYSPPRQYMHFLRLGLHCLSNGVGSGCHGSFPVKQANSDRQGLIAVNYPARKFGIGRHCTVTEAKKLCPNLIAQHVATWKEGEEKWAYHDDAAFHIGTHKVSLDPYRLESRKILTLIKQCLPTNMQKVEKASIDEVFIDLSAQAHSILVQRFPELSNPPPYDDPTEKLPLPPITALDWQADALVDLDDAESEVDNPDWDDVAICKSSAAFLVLARTTPKRKRSLWG